MLVHEVVPVAQRLTRKLRMLRDAQIVDDEEYAELLRLSRSRKKQTRKQKLASARNLRNACKKICKPKRSESKVERQVKKLRSEISETVRQERLKSELKALKDKRREIRDAKRALKDLDFSLL